jgi:hypothetical protein
MRPPGVPEAVASICYLRDNLKKEGWERFCRQAFALEEGAFSPDCARDSL